MAKLGNGKFMLWAIATPYFTRGGSFAPSPR